MERSRRDRLAGCLRAVREEVARRTRLLPAAVVVILAGVGPAGASATGPVPTTILPGDRSVTTVVGSTGPVSDWIVAGRPGERARAVAAIHGAEPVSGPDNTWVIETSRATAFARDLEEKGIFLYAEPNVPVIPAGYPQDTLSKEQWWLPMIVDTGKTTPPKVTPSSPTLALIERSADPLHPDLASARLEDPASIGPAEDLHGTIVAAIAGSPAENGGISGVWPGMKMRIFGQGETCATATEAVYEAARKGLPVINMSYGFPSGVCFSHFQATEFAVHRGSLPIAAAGNTFLDDGNRPMRPATDPHVISVSAVDQSRTVADFATRNDQVDLTAPGVGVLAPWVGVDGGRVFREHSLANGTSFSAPMVAAAATWLNQARSDLSSRQISRLLTSSARDLGPRGWDREYGAGLLNIDDALKDTAPPDDPMEPNDDIGWINGSKLRNKGRPIVAPLIYRPGFESRELVKATTSTRDDPVDVYRMRIGREATVVFRIDQLAGDVSVQTFQKGIGSVGDPRKAFAASDRKASLPEGIKVVNRSRKARDFYIAIKPGSRQDGVYSRYRVTVQSIR